MVLITRERSFEQFKTDYLKQLHTYAEKHGVLQNIRQPFEFFIEDRLELNRDLQKVSEQSVFKDAVSKVAYLIYVRPLSQYPFGSSQSDFDLPTDLVKFNFDIEIYLEAAFENTK